MTIEELNKLIKEELEAYLGEEEGGDDIEVTTDEPEVKDDEALDTLRQIFNMLKPLVEPEEEEEPEMDMDSDMDDEDEADEDMKEGKDDEKDEDAVNKWFNDLCKNILSLSLFLDFDM